MVTFRGYTPTSKLIVTPANPTSSCHVTSTVYLEGNTNSFVIQPKTATGAVLVDSAAPTFIGQDIFFVESYLNGLWYRDQGVATYIPSVNEVQVITFSHSYKGKAITLGIEDYLTPYSSGMFTATSTITNASDALAVQSAIQSLENIKLVDVYKDTNAVAGTTAFYVTYLSALGPVPLLTVSPANAGVTVTEAVQGITEIQTITLASDINYVREIQQLLVRTTETSMSITYNGNTSSTFYPSAANITQVLQTYFVGIDGSPLVVTVDSGASSLPGFTAYNVTFISPVPLSTDGSTGAYPLLSVYTNTDGLQPATEVVTGQSPSVGTFTIFYEGQYTTDIPHYASAATMKAALEGLDAVGQVILT